MMVAADLDYSLTRGGNYYDLEDWQDIISGIDIYISKPIYTYDQNGEFTSFNDDDNMECVFVGRLYNGEKDKDAPDTTLANVVTEDRMLAPFSSTTFMDKYMEYSYAQIYSMYFHLIDVYQMQHCTCRSIPMIREMRILKAMPTSIS